MEDDFGGDYKGNIPRKKRPRTLDHDEDFKEHVEEEHAPGAATGIVLILQDRLKKSEEDCELYQEKCKQAEDELEKWRSTFQNESFTPAGTCPEPGLVVMAVQNLRSSEEAFKEQLEKARKKEAAFIVNFAKSEQKITDLKANRLLLDPAIHEEFTHLKNTAKEKDKKIKELEENLAAMNFTPQSKMGKMLISKCRTLQEENEEIGMMASDGKIHELGMKLKLQKNQNLELGDQIQGTMKRTIHNMQDGKVVESESYWKTIPYSDLTSIDDLSIRKGGHIFEGDVLVIYKAMLHKEQNKQLLRADLTDAKGEITVTLNVTSNFIQLHEHKIVAGKAIRITHFLIAPKTSYDRGDCDFILLLNESSTIENIPSVCIDYKFIPDSTIKHLLSTTDTYATGTIAAIVTSAKKYGMQLILEIKDGNSEEDASKLYLFGTFEPVFATIEQNLGNKQFPMYLFKNLVKRGGAERALKTAQSTFVTPLKNKKALEDLNALLNAKTEVQGTLSVANVYSMPFQLICNECSDPVETLQLPHNTTLHFPSCQRENSYAYTHRLICNIKNLQNSYQQCFLSGPLLKTLLPALTEISHEDYIKEKSPTIYMLRAFSVQATFTLNQHSDIIHVEKTN